MGFNAFGWAYFGQAYAGTVAAAPVNTVAPVASGSTTVGSTVSTSDGTWTGTPAPTFTYQWQRDVQGGGSYSNISSATANSYTLVAADDACDVRCVVTGTNVSGSASANSNSILDTTPVPAANKVPIDSFAYGTKVYARDQTYPSTDAAVTAVPQMFIDAGGAKTATTSFVFRDPTLGRTRSIWKGDKVATSDNAYIAAPGFFT